MTNSDVKVIVASLELILKLLKEKDSQAIEDLEKFINSLKSQLQLKGVNPLWVHQQYIIKSMKLNEKYVNKNVSEDDERYFDFQRYNNDFKKKYYKRVTALIPKSNTEMIKFLEEKESVSGYLYDLIKADMEKNKKQAISHEVVFFCGTVSSICYRIVS